MDEDLKLYLDTKFAGVDRQFEEERAARRQTETNLLAEIGRQSEEERAALRQTETSLLTAFHNWARTYEVKERTLSKYGSKF